MKITILGIYQLDYDYIKICNRLLTVDIGRQKELDSDPKAILQIEFVGQSKNHHIQMVVNASMFALTFLEKLEETKLKFSRGSETVL